MIRKFGQTGLNHYPQKGPKEHQETGDMYSPYYTKKPTSGVVGSGTSGTSGSGGVGGGSSALDRPTTLNLGGGSTSGSSGHGGGLSGPSGSSSVMPNKPLRYTPVLPMTSQSQSGGVNRPATASSSGYSSLGGGGGVGPYSSYSSHRSHHSHSQPPTSDVITVPPSSSTAGKSSLIYERPTGPQTHGTHLQYYMQPVHGPGGQLRVSQQPQSQQAGMGMSQQSGGGGMMGSISKSTQNLIESIPDVFCLSCPPAEFKFSEAYRAKTLPRTGKEVRGK